MTTAVAAAPSRDRLGIWCGWVLIGAAALVPILGWLAPLGFAPLLALVGLLCLPALRIADRDRPAAMILFAALIWAAVSTTWSPYHPSKPANSSILKLAFELPLYWSAISAARRADPVLRTRALHVMAWGCAMYGLVLLEEAVTRGAIYKALHASYEQIRDDIAESHVGHSSQVLALIWPLAACGGPRRWRPWLALAMVLGTGAAARAFGYDEPMLSLVLAPLTALIVWRWPDRAPKVMAVAAAVLFLGMPLLVWGVRHFFDYEAIRHALPKTDSMRLGYWSHAVDWIRLRPVRGWGLDASRMFGPGIVLHPHNSPLQIWLELGGIGAVAAAALWIVALTRLAKPAPSLAAAATAACASVYLLSGVSFGVWQEWWLALGALIAVFAIMNASTKETVG
ncbi:O-antigen ligase family protein [Phenylobacterium sp.]|jgi:O-antigen ligase|uniref:O-antigen ligase family protein n=1 Tax=Phenylobacterium sp. TaxID=1871053 RepID=UPI002E37058E|nr:O-antigen ligase family protein [Phenylobacterium sp.]HEX4710045.1 O-antigen ligase family protein [Phenylobacterium sp.]